MTTEPTTRLTRPPRQRRQPADRPIKVVQPPPQYAHLTGEDLEAALTSDAEVWDCARFAAEAGRSIGRIWVWTSARNKVDAYQRRLAGDPEYADADEAYEDDRTAPTPDAYYGQAPVWRAGRLRRWMMQVGIMDRLTGKFIPHKPGGRQRGALDIDKRAQRPSVIRETAPAILTMYRQLRDAGVRAPAARAAIADRFDLTGKQVMRRLEVGRKLEKTADPAAIEAEQVAAIDEWVAEQLDKLGIARATPAPAELTPAERRTEAAAELVAALADAEDYRRANAG